MVRRSTAGGLNPQKPSGRNQAQQGVSFSFLFLVVEAKKGQSVRLDHDLVGVKKKMIAFPKYELTLILNCSTKNFKTSPNLNLKNVD